MPATAAHPLNHLARTPQVHARLLYYGAVLRIMDRLPRFLSADEFRGLTNRHPFLRGYLDEVRPLIPAHLQPEDWDAWWQSATAAWAESAGHRLPLRSLLDSFGVGPSALMVFMLVGLAEEDPRFGGLYQDLLGAHAGRRPTVDLAGRLALEPDQAERPWDAVRPLHGAGILTVLNPSAPRGDWELSIPALLWDAAHGNVDDGSLTWARFRPVADLHPLAHVLLPADLNAQLQQVPHTVRAGQADTLVVKGVSGSDRRQALGAVAHALGMNVVEVPAKELEDATHLRLLAPLCTLANAMPVIIYDLGPGETVELPSLNSYHGPVGVVANLEGGVLFRETARPLTFTMPFPDRDLRRRYWEVAFAGHPAPDPAELSARLQVTGGAIRQIAAMALTRSQLAGRKAVTMAEILEAGRDINRQALDTLATRLDASGSWDQLVVSTSTAARLHDLELRCRYREQLLEHLSPAYHSGGSRGVKAVFQGPSGTGKTLAARIMAAELGMDIYRVDLSAVVNKYIGETEKNLSKVLARAEELDVILLLDEGDSLLAKRSDVTSSNDRHANMQTNYLLQRLENYQGIVLVTTNFGDSIDKAFQRRFDMTVEFQPPEPAERLRIWEVHLPRRHGLPPDFLEEVAIRCALAGGQIRTAALHATLLAMDSNRPVLPPDIVEAVRLEYAKSGGLSPLLP